MESGLTKTTDTVEYDDLKGFLGATSILLIYGNKDRCVSICRTHVSGPTMAAVASNNNIQ